MLWVPNQMGIGSRQSTPHLEVTSCDLKIRSLITTPIIPSEAADASRVSVQDIRGERVVLDHEAAPLFDVETKKLNQQVTRITEKFGDAFAFRLPSSS